ncbi:MAG: hypothetical protein J7K65_10465, partial [Planctomycetes bacterium]|nr:hypothetical protein [Planctomycetota bacterium]
LWVMQCIYEQDFVGFSYGFRPRRNQHDALDLKQAYTVYFSMDSRAGFFGATNLCQPAAA